MGLLAIRVLMSQNSLTIKTQLHTHEAERFLDIFDQAKSMPHAISETKTQPYGHSRKTSIGKPWYLYDTSVDFGIPDTDHLRLRIVERWMGGGNIRGIIKASLQYISTRDVTYDDMSNSKLNGSQMYFRVTGVDGVEFEKTRPYSIDTVRTRHLKMLFFANGKVFGHLLEDDTQDMVHTNRQSARADATIQEFFDDTHAFVITEKELAIYRIKSGYGNND